MRDPFGRLLETLPGVHHLSHKRGNINSDEVVSTELGSSLKLVIDARSRTMYHERMKIQLVDEVHGNLPLDDDHPYRTGPWKPNTREFDAFDLDLIGELPLDLNGVYLRNTENPLHGAIGRSRDL